MARATKPKLTAETPAPVEASGGNKPVHTIRYRNLKATIWQNQNQSGTFHTVTLTRSYQDDAKSWHDTGSFNASDLPTLAKAVNDAHSWIVWHERRTRESSTAPKLG